MCGIVGLFLKDPALEPELGRLTAGMLATMSDRGPDSAGFAVYGAGGTGQTKLTLRGHLVYSPISSAGPPGGWPPTVITMSVTMYGGWPPAVISHRGRAWGV